MIPLSSRYVTFGPLSAYLITGMADWQFGVVLEWRRVWAALGVSLFLGPWIVGVTLSLPWEGTHGD